LKIIRLALSSDALSREVIVLVYRAMICTELHRTRPDATGDVRRFVLVDENGVEFVRIETVVPHATSPGRDWVRNVAEVSVEDFRFGAYDQQARNVLEGILRKRGNASRA
jgi:hypothetical protein